MRAHIFGPTYRTLMRLLVEARKKSGVTQAEMAAKLDIDQPRLSKVELANGRIDVIQYFTYCRAVGLNPCEIYAEAERIAGHSR